LPDKFHLALTLFHPNRSWGGVVLAPFNLPLLMGAVELKKELQLRRKDEIKIDIDRGRFNHAVVRL